MQRARDIVRDIVQDMGRAEREADIPALKKYLHDDLVFRRASGSIVNRSQFLDQLERRDRLDSEILEDQEDEPPDADSIAVTLLVRIGEGTFRNVRVFVRDGDTWRCKLWVNTKMDTPPPLRIEMLHHVSLPVADLELSKHFYEGILGLRPSKLARPGPPRFDFEGAWYQVGAGQLHLIVHEPGSTRPTYRSGKKLDSRDVHFALRVHDFPAALEYLQYKGYSEDAQEDFKQMKVSPNSQDEGAGFPQIYILDPDRHTIEINAERLDRGEE